MGDELQNAGCLDDCFTPHATCQTSDISLNLELVNWQPRLMHFAPAESARPEWVALQEGVVRRPGLFHAVIDLPSGELWATEWFDLPVFQEALRAEDEGPNIATIYGRLARTRHMADLGLVSVSIGDEGACLVEREGVLMAVFDEEEATRNPGVRVHGTVHPDGGTLSLMDRRRLVDAVARHGCLTTQEAKKQVKAWTSSMPGDLIRIKVTPGVYHLYWEPGREGLAAACAGVADLVPCQARPVFLLSPHPLPGLMPTPRRPPGL